MFIDWQDINFRAEVAQDVRRKGVRFSLWHVKSARNHKTLALSEAFVHPSRDPVMTGIIWNDGCVDAMWGSEPLHFCCYDDFVGIGTALDRLCTIVADRTECVAE